MKKIERKLRYICQKMYLQVIKEDEPKKWPIVPSEYQIIKKGKFFPRNRIHILQDCEEIYPNQFIYEYIDPKQTYTIKTFFHLKCRDCDLIFIINMHSLLNDIGCPWCRQECKKINRYSWYMIKFVGEKVHGDKYSYEKIDKEVIYKPTDLITVICDCSNVFQEKVSTHLSRGNNAWKFGCQKCRKQPEKIIWKYNLDALLEKGFEIFGDDCDYSLVKPDDLQNNTSKIRVICKKNNNGQECGNVFTTCITNHLDSRSGCPLCNGKQRITKENFLERAKKLYQDQFKYDLLPDHFKNNKQFVTLICSTCDNKIKTVVANFLAGKRKCEYCIDRVSWDIKLKEKCLERSKEGEYSYELVDFEKHYTGRSKLTIVCKKCKSQGYYHIFEQTIADHFISNHGCLRCAQNLPWKIRFQQDLESEISKRPGYSYELVDFTQIKNQVSKIPIICLKCKEDNRKNYIFNQTVHIHFSLNCGCPQCGKSKQWSRELFMEAVERLSDHFTDNYDYSLISDEHFQITNGKLPIGCKSCTNVFYKTATKHISTMEGCYHCLMSEGCKIITNWLNTNNYSYLLEYPCQESPGESPNKYRYDYYLEDYNTIIEYDGSQHFRFQPYFHKTQEAFLVARSRDIYKHKKALENNIKIIRIDYKIRKDKITEYLQEGINSNFNEYFSTPEMYQWIHE